MNKKEYTAPTLTVVEFKAERGYAVSGPLGMVVPTQLLGTFNAQGIENWDVNEANLIGDTWDN